MITKESRIEFEFPDNYETKKFDDQPFYRRIFNSLPGSKAVDFVELGKEFIAFIEVKNCLGDEGNCNWRVHPNNVKKGLSKTTVDVGSRDSLDIEVSQKIAMTLAALTGIISFDEDKPFLQEIYGFATSVIQNYLSASNKGKYVILVLEGNFGSRTRTKKMIMEGLQRSISKKLKWLNCKVSVVDSYTYNSRFFKIRTCAEEETDRI